MLFSAKSLLNYPILSLHVGAEIGRTAEIILDPAKLKIVGFFVDAAEEQGDILEADDIRELAPSGMIVDSEGVFVNGEDIVRLRDVLALQFSLFGLKVETKAGTRLGKIEDYIVETEGYKVMQLVVKRPILKAVMDPELIIPRSEIIEVTDTKIIVRDEEEKIRKRAAREAFTPNFVNPFREQRGATQRAAREEK